MWVGAWGVPRFMKDMDGLTVGVMQYSRWVGWWEGRTEEGFEVDDEDWEAVYFHSIFVDAREVGMETSQWIARCALRLREVGLEEEVGPLKIKISGCSWG